MPDNEKPAPKAQMWDADRMTNEDLDKELGSFTGKERAYKAKVIGEDWGFTVGEEAGVKKTVAKQAEAMELLKAEQAKAIESVKEAAVIDAEIERVRAKESAEDELNRIKESRYKIGFADGKASVDVSDSDSGDSDTSEYDRGKADGLAQAAATEEAEEEMVPCPECNGTGKMIGWGDQCKKCYGATKVKKSSLVEEVEADA